MTVTKRIKKNHIDGKKLTEELALYAQEFKKANPKKIRPYTRIKASNYLGGAIVTLATQLAKRPNFSGYSWREEMISDAVECALMYMHNFDPDRSNAHAYLTQLCFNAFILRIKKEKKQSAIRNNLIQNFCVSELFELQDNDDRVYVNEFLENFSSMSNKEEPAYLTKKTIRIKKKSDTDINPNVNRLF
jgi:hypothetical protein